MTAVAVIDPVDTYILTHTEAIHIARHGKLYILAAIAQASLGAPFKNPCARRCTELRIKGRQILDQQDVFPVGHDNGRPHGEKEIESAVVGKLPRCIRR